MKRIIDTLPKHMIKIGEYHIGEMEDGKLWIENMDGEGMATNKEFLIIPITHKFKNEY